LLQQSSEEKNTGNRRKIVTFVMACIIIGFLQVNCKVFNYFEYVRSMNMYNSKFITYVALLKGMCHKSVICHAFITNCRIIKKQNMEVTFCGTASISVVLNIAKVIQKLKHTHIHTHTHTHTHTYTCTCHMLPAKSSTLLR